jgi:hypothetical protein
VPLFPPFTMSSLPVGRMMNCPMVRDSSIGSSVT